MKLYQSLSVTKIWLHVLKRRRRPEYPAGHNAREAQACVNHAGYTFMKPSLTVFMRTLCLHLLVRGLFLATFLNGELMCSG